MQIPDKLKKSMRAAFYMTVARCHNPSCADYKYYGARGIEVCQRWRDSFDNFIEDMGPRPDGMTLDRVDNSGHYEKQNCRWATREQQTRNRRETVNITYEGQTRTMAEWAKLTGIGYHTLKARLRAGYTPEQVLTKTVKCGGLLPDREYAPIVRAKMSEITPRGLASKATRFNVVEIADIRMRLETETKVAVAKSYGVDPTTITRVQRAQGAYSDT